MLPLIMAVCGAAGAVAGVFATQAVNEKDKQAAKKYEKVNTELINKRNELEKRYYELSDRSKQQVNELNLKLAESEMEKDALYLAIRLQNNLISLMEGIEQNPSLEILVEFKKAVALTNHVLKEVKENLVPVSQDYFSRNLVRIDRSGDYSKEQLFDFMSILMNPEQEIINSLISEIHNEIDSQQIFEPKEELQENSIEHWIQQGHQLLNSEEYEQALICFEGASNINKENDEVLFGLSMSLYHLDRIGESLNIIDEALKINPNEDIYWYQQSCCLSELEMQQEALNSINKALKINPNKDIYWYQQSCCLSELEMQQEALKALKKAITINSNKDSYWHQQSTIFYSCSAYNKAIDSIRKAIDINPYDDRHWNLKGVIILDYNISQNKTNLIRIALDAINKAIELHSNKPLYWINKATAFYCLDRNDDALELINKVLQTNSNNDSAWYWQGRILFEMNMFLVFDRKEEALESFEKAISINPDEAEYWYWKSRCLKDIFEKKKALKAIEKAISIECNEEYLQLRDSLYSL